VRPGRAALRVGALTIAAGLAAACVDLFHPTDDIRTACEIDWARCGLCAPSSEMAKDRAARVCAWLGACEGPLGGNAFGPCTLEARLAFDCDANPNHPIEGARRDEWACLAAAQTCEDVHRCVSPKKDFACGGAVVECTQAGIHVECAGPDASPFVESCALWGQTCATAADGSAACAPATVPICATDGGPPGGVDCTDDGAQTCRAFSNDAAPGWAACVPTARSDATCEPSLAVTCHGGVAESCPTGVPESIDCAAWLDTPDACAPGTLAPPGADWTSGCAPEALCPPDSCDGNVLTGCARGAVFSVDCVDAGLRSCSLPTGRGTAVHAACGPP